MLATSPRSRQRRWWLCIFLTLLGLYALLLIPEAAPPSPHGAGRAAFVWRRDAFWSQLEKEFQQARITGATDLTVSINRSLADLDRELESLAGTNLPPTAPVFGVLETNFFQL